MSAAMQAIRAKGVNVVTGSTWTTDAPFRETEEAIAAARSKGVLAVEMEAAALYAFARASSTKVICLAHVTNTMAIAEQDFEKGDIDANPWLAGFGLTALGMALVVVAIIIGGDSTIT